MKGELRNGQESLTPLCEYLHSMPTEALKQALEYLAGYIKGEAKDAPQLERFSLRNKLNHAPAVICQLGHQLSMRNGVSFPEICQQFYYSAYTLAHKNSDPVGQVNAIALILPNEHGELRKELLARTERIKTMLIGPHDLRLPAKILPGFFRIFVGEVKLIGSAEIEALRDKCRSVTDFYAKNTDQCTQLFRTLGGADVPKMNRSDLRKFDSPLMILHAMIDIAQIAQSANLRENADSALRLLSGTLGTITQGRWLPEEAQASFSIADLLLSAVKHQQLRNDMLRFVAAYNKDSKSSEAAKLILRFAEPVHFGLRQFASPSFGFVGSKDIFPLLGFNRDAILADFYLARAMACYQYLNQVANKVLADLECAAEHKKLAVIAGWQLSKTDLLKTAFDQHLKRVLEQLSSNRRISSFGLGKSSWGNTAHGRKKGEEGQSFEDAGGDAREGDEA